MRDLISGWIFWAIIIPAIVVVIYAIGSATSKRK